MEAQPALGELGPAGAQPAAAQRGEVGGAACRQQLDRELTVEVGDRQRHRLQRPPGAAVVAVRRRHVGEPRRRQRGGNQQRRSGRPGRAGGDRVHAHAAAEHRLQRLARARGRLVLEHRVPGVGHHQQVRVGDLRGDFARVGGGGAQVVGAAEDQRGDVGHRFRHRRRRGRRGGPVGARAELVEVEHVRGGERRERARRERADLRLRLRHPFSRAGAAAPREVLLFAGGRVEERRVDPFPFFAFAAERRAPAAARAGRCRRRRRPAPRPGIRPAGAGRSRRPAGCRAARWRRCGTG